MSRAYLTTREAAQIVGCATWQIRADIRAGRLEAEVVHPPPLPGCQIGKTRIRIYPPQFAAYLRVYWPQAQWRA